jgi:hypothetical protein
MITAYFLVAFWSSGLILGFFWRKTEVAEALVMSAAGLAWPICLAMILFFAGDEWRRERSVKTRGDE